MSEIKVNSIKGVGASTAAITVNNTDGTCTANITNNLSNRNIIINGAAQINQRGSQTGKTSSTYFVDRFRVAMGNVGTWSFTRSSDSPDGFARSMKLDCTTAKSSLDADSYMMIQQKIEGQNVQAFAKGTSAAKQFAVSFYIKSNVSGTYTAEVQDNDNNRIASKTFTVSDGNWNRYSLIFPADTTGTFNDDNGQSMDIKIWLVGGSNYTSGTLNTSSWASKVNANRVSSSNVNLASSTSNELYLTGVQLEVGGVVTDFEHRSFGQELALCQRYYFKRKADPDYASGGATMFAIAYNQDQYYANGIIDFPVSMRTEPDALEQTGTATDYRIQFLSTNTVCNGVPTFGGASLDNARVVFVVGSGLTAGQAVLLRSNSSSAYLAFSVEL